MRASFLLLISLIATSAFTITAHAARFEPPVEIERSAMRSEKVEAEEPPAPRNSSSTTASNSNSFSTGGESFKFDFDGGWNGRGFNFDFNPGLKSLLPHFPFSPFKLHRTGWLIGFWLAVTVATAALFQPHVLRAREELKRSPGKSVVLGLVWQLAFWALLAACALLCLILIGFPLLFALVVFDFCLGVFGMTLVFSVVGEWLARKINLSPASIYSSILLGGCLLGLVRMLPFFGSAIWYVAGLFGIGAALGAQFGAAKTPTWGAGSPALPAP